VKNIKRRLPFLTFYYFVQELRRQAVELFRDSDYENSVDVQYVYVTVLVHSRPFVELLHIENWNNRSSRKMCFMLLCII